MSLPDDLKTTPLYALHQELGGKLVPFAGYAMPVNYPMGVLKEHLHTRSQAGLFDVSHMGVVSLIGQGADKALEALVPADICGLAVGRQRYTQFTNARGGMQDDLMVLRLPDRLSLVVNASCKHEDIAHLKGALEPKGIKVVAHPELALLALQGPKAAEAFAPLAPEAARLGFMSGAEIKVMGIACLVTRSGYTGEDGYEIALPAEKAEEVARALLKQPGVAPIGLGARDSLRLEAGLCLYGSDIDQTTSPVEADLVWTIGKRRREEGGFAGDGIILAQLKAGAKRKRVGIKPEGRAPARAHTIIQDGQGRVIGEITSGGFGPSVDGPVAMGYVEAAHAAPGTSVQLIVRDKPMPAKIVALPFFPHRYFK
ncbi:MAG: glycine cleavage system aminomethyltransferase GcvT [Alphaproteobacteria bacterium]|nr:glycine cleavage system aminomethyltransferase GcvT [Alphaproteobacteria bacterium]